MSKRTNLVYLDNNGTTQTRPQVIQEIIKWMKNINNPSTDNFLSEPSKQLISFAQEYILKHCKVSMETYSVIFTSSGCESNSFILRSTTSAYKNKFNKIPHVIVSAIEHSSIIDCVECLYKDGCLTYSLVEPNVFGIIEVETVKKYIKNNTCLISVMYANNEVGSINDVYKIAKMAEQNNIPFHTDATQIFGKIPVNMNGLTALSASFHKFYSGNGIGLLIIKNSFIESYKLKGIINGSQQKHLRGGTESTAIIAGALKGLIINFNKRGEKNKKLFELRTYTLDKLSSYIPIVYYSTYKKYTDTNDILFVLFGPEISQKNHYMPNTILMSTYIKNFSLCNVLLKKELEQYGIIVSIGSACNTSSKNASHVIKALNVPDNLKRGVLRISFGDFNIKTDVDKFVKILLMSINKQFQINSLLKKPIRFLNKKVRFNPHIENILTNKDPKVIRKEIVKSILKK